MSIDPEANRSAVGVEAFVQAPDSTTAILVVPTDEEGVILDEVLRQMGERGEGISRVSSLPCTCRRLGKIDCYTRTWLSGRASPCQGEGRGFESRRPLQRSAAQGPAKGP